MHDALLGAQTCTILTLLSLVLWFSSHLHPSLVGLKSSRVYCFFSNFIKTWPDPESDIPLKYGSDPTPNPIREPIAPVDIRLATPRLAGSSLRERWVGWWGERDEPTICLWEREDGGRIEEGGKKRGGAGGWSWNGLEFFCFYIGIGSDRFSTGRILD